ncbi:MAG: DUF89 family protein [Thermoproteales archaeon]|nr:DUF89 family protein [Thermoproteales archaeon]
MNPFLDYVCFECLAKLASYLGRLTGRGVEDAVITSAKLMEGYSRAMLTWLDDYVKLCKAVVEHTAKVVQGDPFMEVKEASMTVASKLLPLAESYVRSGDELERAVKVAVAANALDFGTGVYSVDLREFEAGFLRKVEAPLAINDVAELEEAVQGADTILYVLDNAGECVLDLPLVRALSDYARVIVAARGGPVLNDATIVEAERAGLARYAELITTGARLPCISLEDCSPEFRKVLADADVAVLKGQGNFQSFYEVLKIRRKPTFYLFTPKCRPVAKLINADVGALVAYRYR